MLCQDQDIIALLRHNFFMIDSPFSITHKADAEVGKTGKAKASIHYIAEVREEVEEKTPRKKLLALRLLKLTIWDPKKPIEQTDC